MKKSARRSTHPSLKKSRNIVIALFAVAFLLGSAILGLLVWRTQDMMALSATEASASQAGHLRCKDEIRIKFDNDIREDGRWIIDGNNPEGVFAKDGRLHVEATAEKPYATLLFEPWIRSRFVYQAKFLGFESTGVENPSTDVQFQFFGSHGLGLRIYKDASGKTFGRPLVQNPIGLGWEVPPTHVNPIALPAQFKLRLLVNNDERLIMVKDMTTLVSDPMRVIFKQKIQKKADRGASGRVQFLTKIENGSPSAKVSPLFENFRIFCPSEIPAEWVRDINF